MKPKTRKLYDDDVFAYFLEYFKKDLGITAQVELKLRNKANAVRQSLHGKVISGGYVERSYRYSGKVYTVYLYAGGKYFDWLSFALAHEMRHVWQYETGMLDNVSTEKASNTGTKYHEFPEEKDADDYGNSFTRTESITDLDVKFRNNNQTGIKVIRKFRISK